MIKKVIKTIKKVFIPRSEFEEETTPKKVDTTPKVQSDYRGVPAPVVSPDDPWSGAAPKTEKQKEYQQQEATQRLHDDIRRKQQTNEPENIHQMMYERASKYWGTWKEELPSPGGSENFQSGWNSGTGLRQFK